MPEPVGSENEAPLSLIHDTPFVSIRGKLMDSLPNYSASPS
jgi:hypothetical protein